MEQQEVQVIVEGFEAGIGLRTKIGLEIEGVWTEIRVWIGTWVIKVTINEK